MPTQTRLSAPRDRPRRRFAGNVAVPNRSRGAALAAAVLGLLLALPATVPPVAAAEIVRGTRVTIAEPTTIRDDLYLVAGNVQLLGTVAGDVTAAAAVLNLVGRVDGSLTVVAGRTEVRGVVGRAVRVAGGSVAVYGRVAGDVVVAGGTLTIVEGATIEGDLVVAGNAVTVVEGATVAGDLVGSVRTLTVEGRIGGALDATVDRLVVTRRGRIDGPVRYRSDRPAEVDERAIVVGPVERGDPAPLLPVGGPLAWRGFALPRWAALLTAGAVLLLIAPRRVVAVAEAVRATPLTALPVGLGVAVLGPIGLGLLVLTIVALPIVALAGAAYAAALYLSQVVVGLAVGRLLLRLSPARIGRGPNVMAMALGVTLLAALRLAPVPYAGIALPLAIALLGVGAIVLGLRRPIRPAASVRPVAATAASEPRPAIGPGIDTPDRA